MDAQHGSLADLADIEEARSARRSAVEAARAARVAQSEASVLARTRLRRAAEEAERHAQMMARPGRPLGAAASGPVLGTVSDAVAMRAFADCGAGWLGPDGQLLAYAFDDAEYRVSPSQAKPANLVVLGAIPDLAEPYAAYIAALEAARAMRRPARRVPGGQEPSAVAAEEAGEVFLAEVAARGWIKLDQYERGEALVLAALAEWDDPDAVAAAEAHLSVILAGNGSGLTKVDPSGLPRRADPVAAFGR